MKKQAQVTEQDLFNAMDAARSMLRPEPGPLDITIPRWVKKYGVSPEKAYSEIRRLMRVGVLEKIPGKVYEDFRAVTAYRYRRVV